MKTSLPSRLTCDLLLFYALLAAKVFAFGYRLDKITFIILDKPNDKYLSHIEECTKDMVKNDILSFISITIKN